MRALAQIAPVLATQTFSGNKLVRGVVGSGRQLQQILGEADGAQYMLVADRSVAVTPTNGGGGSSSGSSGGARALRWLDRAALADLGITYRGSGEQLTVGDQQQAVADVYFLGAEAGLRSTPAAAAAAAAAPAAAAVVRLAVDVSAAPPAFLEAAQISLQDLRSLMPLLPPGDLAVAGQAVALASWHTAHRFCGRCGAATHPAEGGSRRQCGAVPAHRQYPRTDPVVIMLVESPDGTQALLGRSKNIRQGMLTCLSGFVDQGETIEEAVRRETREEAGVQVGPVDIVGSQPWPVGRGGSCELMIGCIAQAHPVGADICIDPVEMADVRWISRADVAEAVRQSSAPDNPYLGGTGASRSPRLDYFVPPPLAIAHHLLRCWAEHEGPWFGTAAGTSTAEAAETMPPSHL